MRPAVGRSESKRELPVARVSSVSMTNRADSYEVALILEVRKDFPWEVLKKFFDSIKADPQAFFDSLDGKDGAAEGFLRGLQWAQTAEKKRGKKKR